MGRMRFRIPASALVVLAIIGVWELCSLLKWADPLLLPSPLAVLSWLCGSLLNTDVLVDIGMTLGRVFTSFILAAAIGVSAGMMLGYLPLLERAFRFPVDFLRSIPATALFPLFMLLLGPGEAPRAAAAVYGASLIILMSTLSGAKRADRNRILAARAYGATGYRLLWHVYFPEALPSIMTGCRLGVSICFVIIVLVEMFIGTTTGLGHRVIYAQMLYEIPEVYGSILLTGILGYSMNTVFAQIERRVTHYAQY